VLPRSLTDARKQRPDTQRIAPCLTVALIQGPVLREFALANCPLLKILPLLRSDTGQAQVLDAWNSRTSGECGRSIDHLIQGSGDHRGILRNACERVNAIAAPLSDSLHVEIAARRPRFWVRA
jgi:hypothetical protein